MPLASLKPCRHSGCSQLVRGGGRCATHREQDREYTRFLNRKPWLQIRFLYLLDHPYCVDCEKAGRHTRATAVHHRVDRRDGGDEYDEGNLMALCTPCHGKYSRWGRS